MEQLPDPHRTSRSNIRHSLEAIVVMGLCAVVCGGEGFEAMELIGNTRKHYFECFLGLPNGIPSADTFRRVFGRLDPKGLSKCLNRWLAAERVCGELVAIDGKTICGSADEPHRMLHVVSAFVAEKQLTLGQWAMPERTNEITAIRELLDIIDISETIMTAGAMACQKKLLRKSTKRAGITSLDSKEIRMNFIQTWPSISQTLGTAIPSSIHKRKRGMGVWNAGNTDCVQTLNGQQNRQMERPTSCGYGSFQGLSLQRG